MVNAVKARLRVARAVRVAVAQHVMWHIVRNVFREIQILANNVTPDGQLITENVAHVDILNSHVQIQRELHVILFTS